MGGTGDPDEHRLRRLDAMEGIKRLLAAEGRVPGWWYRLQKEIEDDA